VVRHGYTQWTSYQPASRFWPLQWIEGSWLLAPSALLIGATIWLVRRRAVLNNKEEPMPITRWLAATILAASLAAAAPAVAAVGGAAPSGTAPSGATAPLNCAPPGLKLAPCLSPQAFQIAYGVAPLLSRGVDGRGETVVMAEVAQTPATPGGPTDIRRDLATFDSKFGLPAASLRVVNTIARSATPYLAEYVEVQDAEMVHAIAPSASLDVVLVSPGSTSGSAAFASIVTKVVQEGIALHAAVVLASAATVGEQFFTSAEVAQMNAALEQARERHVTVVASSGDSGAISDQGPPIQVNMPASDPLVLAVGGTMLDAARPAGTYLGEMAWNDNPAASGGGYSGLFPHPAYQDGVAGIGSARGVPDVAANTDTAGAMAIAFGDGTLGPASDANAAVPLWAGVIALADQEAGRPLGLVNPAIYAIAASPAYHQAFHDVVTGDNSVLRPTGVYVGYNARPGWDPVTGWGSPDAEYLVPLLARLPGVHQVTGTCDQNR
jgi:subtilase family serine protease